MADEAFRTDRRFSLDLAFDHGDRTAKVIRAAIKRYLRSGVRVFLAGYGGEELGCILIREISSGGVYRIRM